MFSSFSPTLYTHADIPMNRVKRPFPVTCLIALVLTLTVTQLLRAWAALSAFNFYSEMLELSPAYFVLSGLTWGVLGIWLAGGLWRGAAWAPRAARLGLVAFAVIGWLDRLLLQAQGPQTISWAFQLAVTTILLITVFAALALPQAQVFYGEHDERPLKTRRTK